MFCLGDMLKYSGMKYCNVYNYQMVLKNYLHIPREKVKQI